MNFDTKIEQEGWSRVWRWDGACEDIDREDDPYDELSVGGPDDEHESFSGRVSPPCSPSASLSTPSIGQKLSVHATLVLYEKYFSCLLEANMVIFEQH